MRLVCSSFKTASSGKMHVAENARENVTEILDSIITRIKVRGQTIREVGILLKLSDREVLEKFLEADEIHERKLWQDAYRQGRLSNTPNLIGLRRAA